MSNIVIATPALSDEATITAGSEAGALQASNLQTIQVADPWRASDLNNAYLVVDLGSAQAINLVALIANNASSSATWRIRGATSEANLTASPGYDSGSLSMLAKAGLADWSTTDAVLWLSSAQSYRWWRIDVSDASNADGYFQAGRLYISAAWQPSVNLNYGWQMGFVDFSLRPRSAGGQVVPLERSRARYLVLSLDFQSEADLYDNAFEIDRTRGHSKDIFVLRDPDSASYRQEQSIYGLQEELAPIINPRVNMFSKRFRIEELIP